MASKFRRALYDLYNAPGGYVDRKTEANKRGQARKIEMAGVEGDINRSLEQLRAQSAMELQQGRQEFDRPEQRLRLRKGSQELNMANFDEGLAREFAPELIQQNITSGRTANLKSDLMYRYLQNMISQGQNPFMSGQERPEPAAVPTAVTPPKQTSISTPGLNESINNYLDRFASTPLGWATGFQALNTTAKGIERGSAYLGRKLKKGVDWLTTPREWR